MSENLLKFIKEKGLKHDDIIDMIKSNSKILKTREEIRDEVKKEIETEKERVIKEKEKEAAEEAKAKEEADKEGEPETDDIKKQLAALEKEVKELKGKGIQRKPPSKGKETDEEDLPDTVDYSIKKNMFEVDI